MKNIGVKEAKDRFSELLDISQHESVTVMSHGRLRAVIIGVDGVDQDNVILAELQRRRLTGLVHSLSGDELAESLGIDPKERAKWRKWAQANIKS